MNLQASYNEHIQTLQAGYERALASSGFEQVIIHSGRGLKQRSVDDQYWPLKTNPSFLHWLPIEQPDHVLVIRPGQRPQLIRPQENSIWEGPAHIEGSHFWDSFDLIECAPEAIAGELRVKGSAFIGDVVELADTLGVPVSAQNPGPLVSALEASRVIKSSYEIACLTQASRIAADGHAHVARLFAEGAHSELELHLAYLQRTQQNATDTPYSNIVALGRNAAVLHHVHYRRDKDESAEQSLLVDAGATSMGYASDITRTIVRGTSAAARDFGSLIEGMHALQEKLCAQVKPGLLYEELHNQSHVFLAELLIERELCTGSADALVEQGITRAFFPHGLGHSLGLQVHDVGCRLVPPKGENPFLRNTSSVAAGQVFTVEPGCYFIEGLLAPLKASPAGALVSWPMVDRLFSFGGIRIEDNLVVTDDASINLTRDNWPSQQ